MARFFLKFWWAGLFMLLCYGFYAHGMGQRNRDLRQLEDKRLLLTGQLQEASVLKGELLLEVESQGDPAFVQMVMRKQLGMVAQGDTKVCFED